MVVLVAFGVGQSEGQTPSPDNNPTAAAALFESVAATAEDTIYLMYFNLQTHLASIYFHQGEQDKTFALMDQVVSTTEDRAVCYRVTALAWRAKFYALAFDYDAAVHDMNAAIELESDNPELYVLRGQYVLLTYEWDQVLADYNRAIALDPGYADAYFLRGVLFYTQGPREKALDDFEYYLELAPNGLHIAEAANYSDLLHIEFATLDD